jgi:hypothetical protein
MSIITKALIAAIASLFIALGLIYWEMTLKEELITIQANKIGAQGQLISQQARTIADIEIDKAKLRARHGAADKVIEQNRLAQEKLLKTDKLLRTEIDRLKHERKEINEYLNVAV